MFKIIIRDFDDIPSTENDNNNFYKRILFHNFNFLYFSSISQ